MLKRSGRRNADDDRYIYRTSDRLDSGFGSAGLFSITGREWTGLGGSGNTDGKGIVNNIVYDRN